ncbi:ribosomal protein S18 acetylase RimI-like enzyme [Herbihabitans rhizosphaerae]|uniref:Ribosomal protein S18 acetylase RimI-like enzyme n=1 Tax=Herbihabitans rhizosphaerae TaxID=1872711 RepID=A0A4Q7KRG0_9PSEU|nr:GNAT family N-acetyltransferase [Herbihabitans rhizosphaerae]RZS38996.1 ribosomal protein S18 acetylase RimI-like enzyme [Herbihabitans rhizosphaerae]
MDTAALTFRDAGEADIPELVPLIESAYRGEASRAGWTTEADYIDGQRTDSESVRSIIDAVGSRLVTVERAGELVACFLLEQRGPHAYFGLFAVRPELQGSGLGKVILAEAERIAHTEWGSTEMHMTVVNVRAELIAWYERRGYRVTDERKPFPYGDERFGVPRRDDLEFVLLAKSLDAEQSDSLSGHFADSPRSISSAKCE